MRLRLFFSFSLVVLITAAAVVGITTLTTGREVRQFIQRGGFSGNEWLVDGLEAYYQVHGSWQGAETVIRAPHPGPGQGGSPGGRMMGDPPEHVILSDTDGNVLLEDGFVPTENVQLTQDDLDQAIALYHQDTVVGYLVPETRVPILPAVELALLNRLNRSAVIAAGIAGVFALGLALVLAYILQRPIRDLTRAAAAMAEGDLTQRVRPQGKDEIATLSQTFNNMANSLEQAEVRRKAMTADIAHELRNPLAVQRANLEALLDDIYALRKENLEPVLQQTMLLERLVEDLRTLALADSGQMTLDRVPTDMPALVRRKVTEMDPRALARSIHLEMDLPQNCRLFDVDPGRIEQVLANLLENAMQHTYEDGRIMLHLVCSGEEFTLSVRDTGPGIPDEDLPHIFERFFRGDKARSRSEGNTGLGLSIARRIAEAHGGRLKAGNHPEGGAIFTLSIPAAG